MVGTAENDKRGRGVVDVVVDDVVLDGVDYEAVRPPPVVLAD